jgi:thioredoxin 1
MKLDDVNDLDFEQEVLGSDRPVLVEFGGTWCQPCKRQEPILEKLAAERDDVRFVKVDIDDSPNVAATYGIRGVPTLVVFREGKPAARAIGLQPPARVTALLDG